MTVFSGFVRVLSLIHILVRRDVSTKGMTRKVESCPDMSGLLSANHRQQHREKSVYRISIDTGGGAEVFRVTAKESPKSQGMPIQYQ